MDGVGLLDKLLVSFSKFCLFNFEFGVFPESGLVSIFFSFSTLSLFLKTSEAGMLNVLSDLSNNFGDEDGEHIDLLMADSEESEVDDEGGAEFRPNNGLNLFRDFGLGDRS